MMFVIFGCKGKLFDEWTFVRKKQMKVNQLKMRLEKPVIKMEVAVKSLFVTPFRFLVVPFVVH